MHVLLVEDDRDLADAVRRGLARYGYEVTWAATGRAGLAVASGFPGASGGFGAAGGSGGSVGSDGSAVSPVDMVLLDLGLPDIDGLDVCRALRVCGDVPLIVISGRDSETEKVVGLELGADDYVVKPFLVRELVARMRAVRRRQRAVRTGAEVYGRLTVDRRSRRVFVDGAEVALRPKEFALLAFLTDRLGALVPRAAIMAGVWDGNWSGPTKTLDVHVTALRRKLGGAVRIESVRGVGFRTAVGGAASLGSGEAACAAPRARSAEAPSSAPQPCSAPRPRSAEAPRPAAEG